MGNNQMTINNDESSNKTIDELLREIKTGEFEKNSGPSWEEYKAVVELLGKCRNGLKIASNAIEQQMRVIQMMTNTTSQLRAQVAKLKKEKKNAKS